MLTPAVFSAGKEQVVLLWDRCLSHFGNYVGNTNFFLFLLPLVIQVEDAAAMLLYYRRMNDIIEDTLAQRFWKHILTLRRLMSYIYGAPILDVSRSHTTTQHSR